MSQMIADYMLEEYGKEILETQEGFALYVLNKEGGEVFLSDLYIKPEFRKTFAGKKIFEQVKQIAIDNGCEWVTGNVSFGLKSPERATKILKSYLSLGFMIMTVHPRETVLGYKVDGN